MILNFTVATLRFTEVARFLLAAAQFAQWLEPWIDPFGLAGTGLTIPVHAADRQRPWQSSLQSGFIGKAR